MGYQRHRVSAIWLMKWQKTSASTTPWSSFQESCWARLQEGPGTNTGSGAAPLISCSSQGSRTALPITVGSRATQETPGDPHPPGGSPLPRAVWTRPLWFIYFLISILVMMENAALGQNNSTRKPKAVSVFLGNSHHLQHSAVPSSPRKGSCSIVWMFGDL